MSAVPVWASSGEFLALFDATFDGIAVWESDPWRIEYANQAFSQLVGAPAELHRGVADVLDRFRRNGDGPATITACLNAGPDNRPIEVRLCRIARGDKPLVGMIVRAFADESPTMRDSSDSAR